MQGGGNNNKSVIKLKPGSPPLEVTTTMQKASEGGKAGIFSVERHVTYAIGKRHLSLIITEIGSAGRGNVVYVKLSEENGRGSVANLSLRIIRDDRYGVLCNLNTKLAGSYDSFKESYAVPPLQETELVCYFCRDTGSGSCFSMVKKKKGQVEFVESLKATHAFVIDDELTFNVAVKVRNDKRSGLMVEVEGPMKLTMDYTKQVISAIRGKMDSQMEASTFFLFKNSGMRATLLTANASNGGKDGDDDEYWE